MDAADYLSIVKVSDAFTNCVVSAGANALGGKDIDHDDTNDAVAAASGAAHGQVVVVAETDQALHP